MDIGADGWARLARALNFYKIQGYDFVALPWEASVDAIHLTLPAASAGAVATMRYHRNGGQERSFLVGSAEQSFLDRAWMGKDLRGKRVAITPCFRTESEYSDSHCRYFMKVELWHGGTSDDVDLLSMAEDARTFMDLELRQRGVYDRLVQRAITADGFDLELNDVEIGSYGKRRTLSGTPYIYGTGLAEPRFSYATDLL